MDTPFSISQSELRSRFATAGMPIVLDVRREAAFVQSDAMIPGARRCRPEEVGAWPGPRDAGAEDAGVEIAVYCVHGHEVSRDAAAQLRDRGFAARALEGGFEAWREAGGPLLSRAGWAMLPEDGPSRWVTRARPKIDRVACPWLVRRFVDRDAVFDYVPSERVLAAAAETGAVPYDIPDVTFTHVGPSCSFDAFIAQFGLRDPALDVLAEIVRDADTGGIDKPSPAAGLLAVSLGLSILHQDDHAMLARAMDLYDALYAWCRSGRAETHGWPPKPAA